MNLGIIIDIDLGIIFGLSVFRTSWCLADARLEAVQKGLVDADEDKAQQMLMAKGLTPELIAK